MDKIYSRPRIRLPKIQILHNNRTIKSSKAKKILIIIAIMIITIITFTIVLNSVMPIFEKICRDKAKGIATMVTNQKATEVMAIYEYSDIIKIHKDSNDNITMIESNIVNINKIISDVAIYIQDELDNAENQDISIKLGSITGINMLSGMGPDIPIKISAVGNIETDFRSEFINQGINQTLHRVYLDIVCEVTILTPYKTLNETIKNQLIIAENIIVGNIPLTYYNLEGLDNDNLVDMVE